MTLEELDVLDNLKSRGLGLQLKNPPKNDVTLKIWVYEVKEFLRNTAPHLLSDFVQAFVFTGVAVTEDEEDAADLVRRIKRETVAQGITNAVAILVALGNSYRPPRRDPRFDELFKVAEDLRALTNGTSYSLHELATRLWMDVDADVNLALKSPSTSISLAVDDAVASRMALWKILREPTSDEVRELATSFRGAVRVFEHGLGLVLDGFRAAKQVGPGLQELFEAFRGRYGEFLIKYDAFERLFGEAMHVERLKTLSVLRSGVVDGGPRTQTFYVGQRADALLAVREAFALAQREILYVDEYVDTIAFQLLDDGLTRFKLRVLTSPKGLTKPSSSSFTVVAEARNGEIPGSVSIRTTDELRAHDRYIVVDDERVFHLGASFKDAGKKVWTLNSMTAPQAAECRKILAPLWDAGTAAL